MEGGQSQEQHHSARIHLPTLPSLGFRSRSAPDVPEDVAVALLHLNDPNWEFDSETSTISSDTLELGEKSPTSPSSKHHYASSFDMTHSIRTRTSDYDTSSQVDSHTHIRSSDALDYEE